MGWVGVGGGGQGLQCGRGSNVATRAPPYCSSHVDSPCLHARQARTCFTRQLLRCPPSHQHRQLPADLPVKQQRPAGQAASEAPRWHGNGVLLRHRTVNPSAAPQRIWQWWKTPLRGPSQPEIRCGWEASAAPPRCSGRQVRPHAALHAPCTRSLPPPSTTSPPLRAASHLSSVLGGM